MRHFFIWEPTQKRYILLINDFSPILSRVKCSFCEKINRVYGRKVDSQIFFDDSGLDIVPSELYTLDKLPEEEKLAKSLLYFPVNAKEWAILLTKDHEFSPTKIDAIRFKRALKKPLREINVSLRKNVIKHIFCISPLFLNSPSTLSHPQIRCFEFSHRILRPFRIHEDKSSCSLCYETGKLGKKGERVIERSKHFVAFTPLLMLQEGEIIITTLQHKSFESLNREELDDLAKILSDIILKRAKEIGGNMGLIVLLDALEKSHIYIRIISLRRSLPLDCSLHQILNDRSIKIIFNYGNT
ncbi:MAG: hypothetical protein ACP6IP_01300 [Candidatus Njordarchaeia archaeon]